MDEDESYECHDHDNRAQQILEFESNEFENDRHRRLETEINDYENVNHQLLEKPCSDSENYTLKLLEIENEDHEDGNELVLELNGNMLESEDTEQFQADIHTQIMSVDDQSTVSQDKYYPPPVTGMEFESYDDAYNYYNSYAKELGFAIRVKSSWTKRNSKEKRGAVLCCNCEGFKTAKEATSRRKETRTGCLAMIRLRSAESGRWRVDEVKLDHNHSFDPERVVNSKSHKKMEAEAKRNSEPSLDVEVRTIKLYCTSASDLVGYTSVDTRSKRLKLLEGDIQAIHDYFCQVQLGNPNFMYLMDLNDEGQLRNVFWIDSRSRAAYSYFGDVVAIDTTYLSNKYDVPLVVFVGINHHGKSILFGCSLLVDDTVESYTWVFRVWLTCILGRPPQTVITDQGKAIQIAISEVFPRANHRLSLPLVLQSIFQNLGPIKDSEGFQLIFERTIYGSLRVDEFENSWAAMIQRFGIDDLVWLQNLYEDRERWAPVYLKDTFLAGLFTSPADDPVIPFFNDCVHERTSVREFVNIYKEFVQKIHQLEAVADYESSSESSSSLGHPYQLQLSKLYTKEIFSKFQAEVEMISSCLNISQVHASGPVTTYMIKEQAIGTSREFSTFEVMYDKMTSEVRCICGCFYVNGYLCRHSLCVLNCNDVKEIPLHYILPRWRKDCKRSYVLDIGSNAVDDTNPMQWYEHLYKRAMQLVEQGMVSQDHYTVAWQAFKESLNKVRLAKGEKHL